MFVRGITGAEYQAAKDVWAQCFPEDTPAFIDYYFEKRTCPENVLGAFDGGRMVGALHMLRQTIRLRGEEKQIGFIAGVGTIPAQRRRGVARDLLYAAEGALRAWGCCAALLQPVSVAFYEKCGYVPFVRRNAFTISAAGGGCAVHAPHPKELLELYQTFSARYDGMKKRTLRDFELLLEEMSLCGEMALASKNAYALFGREQGETRVFELVGEDAASLLQAVAAEGKAPVHAALPMDMPSPVAGKEEVFNMVRVLQKDVWDWGPEPLGRLYSLEYY